MGFGLDAPLIQFDLLPSRRLLYAASNKYERGLNIGAGSQCFKGSADLGITIDNHSQFPAPFEHHNLGFDLTEPWPVAPGSYDIIWGFHVIEHIPLHKVVGVFGEVRKALSLGGIFIIEVPDAKGITKEYADGNYGMMENIMGEDHYPGNAHRWHYCGPDLVVLLHVAGFDRTYTRAATSYHAEQQPCIRVEAVSYGSHWSQSK